MCDPLNLLLGKLSNQANDSWCLMGANDAWLTVLSVLSFACPTGIWFAIATSICQRFGQPHREASGWGTALPGRFHSARNHCPQQAYQIDVRSFPLFALCWRSVGRSCCFSQQRYLYLSVPWAWRFLSLLFTDWKWRQLFTQKTLLYSFMVEASSRLNDRCDYSLWYV